MNGDIKFIIESTVKKTLEELGMISKFIGRSEMIKRIGITKYNHLVKSGKLKVNKSGTRNARITALRSDFENLENNLQPCNLV